jgi:hypothetical protein
MRRGEERCAGHSYLQRRVPAIVKNDIFDIDMAMKIDVLSVNGVFDTGLAAVLDAFATANELAVAQGLTAVSFEVTVVGLRRRVRSKQGFTVRGRLHWHIPRR